MQDSHLLMRLANIIAIRLSSFPTKKSASPKPSLWDSMGSSPSSPCSYPVRSTPQISPLEVLLLQIFIYDIPTFETDMLFMDDYALLASDPSLAEVQASLQSDFLTSNHGQEKTRFHVTLTNVSSSLQSAPVEHLFESLTEKIWSRARSDTSA